MNILSIFFSAIILFLAANSFAKETLYVAAVNDVPFYELDGYAGHYNVYRVVQIKQKLESGKIHYSNSCVDLKKIGVRTADANDTNFLKFVEKLDKYVKGGGEVSLIKKSIYSRKPCDSDLITFGLPIR